ncbi:F0F1 ATP synthase subunit alpha [bacterium]|nr:F0F1 ATP synthase subunit alpha [bacterium]|tara:strand:+ start:6966 stop:8477 length:1512 start_codon:yes stop_codon:yes gene_type:complete
MKKSQDLINDLKEKIKNLQTKARVQEIGHVLEVGDGVARVSGLSSVMMSEMLEFGEGNEKIYGLALNLEQDSIGAIILGDYKKIKQGDIVQGTGKVLSIPVGEKLIGRVINPLGQAIDGQAPIVKIREYPIERIAPGVITRQEVSTPLQTGIKAIDSMIPIGRGQRELIIGDRQTGKTAIAIDTIINQKKNKNIICIYVAIGQKESKIAKIKARLEQEGAMEHTIIVSAPASSTASLQYIAPYAGCAIGEYFMDKGKDALVIYDDLSKHAWAYRQISLLLKRPPGREAYPGDIFYLHSRLLERSAKLSKDQGGGSLTALPIIETQAGDVSAYIPTNVISITDGQIYLESDLFYQGIRPALNVGLSVSRVGSKAQIKAMKKVAGQLRLDLAQYRELAAFAQFGADLDEKTKAQLERGKRAQEILKQEQYVPVDVYDQVIILFALTKGLLDDIPVEKLKEFESGLLEYFNTTGHDVLKKLKDKNDIHEDIDKALIKIIKDFKNTI